MKKISRWIMVLGILVLLIPFVPNSIVNAQTSDYMLSSVAGEWTAVNEGTGVGTSVVKWGTGIWETDYKQSGLEFVGRTNESFNEGEIFPLGTLTHMNWPVQPPFATAATLQITLDFASPNITPSPTFSFDLTIEETTNEYSWRHCHSGFQQTHTPCDDRIQFPPVLARRPLQSVTSCIPWKSSVLSLIIRLAIQSMISLQRNGRITPRSWLGNCRRFLCKNPM